ncbi:hypothetical protein LF1_31900 [Rubripirellula obstinata]|uniref:Uncharacterized protein n=1 Tax=Rubripirellula obstinata TaxID=406547 RepID=A0A5B1CM73_9BACT|nr:hypothetical protein LF1_31900 [Rubripirellula obstinata]
MQAFAVSRQTLSTWFLFVSFVLFVTRNPSACHLRLRSSLPSIKPFRGEIDSELQHLIEQLCQKDPDRRLRIPTKLHWQIRIQLRYTEGK